MKARPLLILSALFASAIFVLKAFGVQEEQALNPPSAQHFRQTTDGRQKPKQVDAPLALRVTDVAREIGEYDSANPFAPTSWQVAPPPAPAAPPTVTAPSVPVLPSLPFRLVGTLEVEPTHLIYYLANGQQEFRVAVGDSFAGMYRLESADAHRLVITYLPLQAAQTLQITQQ